MTNQRRTRFINLLTANDPTEARRAQLMTNAFWLASPPVTPARLAQVLDLRAHHSRHPSRL